MFDTPSNQKVPKPRLGYRPQALCWQSDSACKKLQQHNNRIPNPTPPNKHKKRKPLALPSSKGSRGSRLGFKSPGGGLPSQRVSPQVFSLLTRFTFVFGMGTGGSTSPCHQTCQSTGLTTSTLKTAQQSKQTSLCGQALDRLVPLGYTHYCAYTYGLSTRLSSGGLTSLRYGGTHLQVGFKLRCFQLLSAPDTATGHLPLAG